MNIGRGVAIAVAMMLAANPGAAWAQSDTVPYVNAMPPVMDNEAYLHALLDEFEGRYNGNGGQFRYDAQAWYGTDYNKLWIKSEGTLNTAQSFGDGDHEVLYDRAISRYFDLQSGVRLDIDGGPTRAWGAIGIEGLSLYFFTIEATGYFSDRGVAARLKGSYELLLTNRLILEPQVEMNFYSTSDRARNVGSGLSGIDTGLRLRYEFWRKFAPYVGVTYGGSDGPASPGARRRGVHENDLNFAFGIRMWW